jgi:ribosome-associated toxin RatA of RatAB toxin-antitoxin module
MRFGRLCLLAVFLAAPGACAAAAFLLDTERRGEAIEIVARAEIRTNAEHAWAVLTAYERYAEFIPDVATSRVVTRNGSTLVLDLTGAVGVLWWREPVAVRLAVSETAPRRVRSRMISGTLQALEGQYELARAPGGVRLTYTGRIVPDSRQRGLLERFIVHLNVSRQFGALVAEIERAPQPHATRAPGG